MLFHFLFQEMTSENLYIWYRKFKIKPFLELDDINEDRKDLFKSQQALITRQFNASYYANFYCLLGSSRIRGDEGCTVT